MWEILGLLWTEMKNVQILMQHMEHTHTHKKVKGEIKVAFRGMFVLDTCTE